MIYYELIEKTDEKVVYRYYPEGKKSNNTPGKLTYFFNTGEFDYSEIAEEDKKHVFYFPKMRNYIERFVESGNYRENGIIAIY
ncbi:MAG: hypothetical protein IKC47_03715 [Clostridia bacterium]|nr:hypothetical protein [Clostridia bacterium]